MAEENKNTTKETVDKTIEKPLNIHQRIANFQQDNVVIPKSKAAYGYSYAPLDHILEIITPHLKTHGIGISHRIETRSKEQYLLTKVFNFDKRKDFIECETFIDDTVNLAKQNKFMVIGSAITYFRRYHVVTMLGLTTDQDTDAGGAQQGNQKQNDKNPPTSTGRSVESASPSGENTVDYVNIFENLLNRNKDEKTVRKSYDNYKKNMTKEVSDKIMKLIDDKFKKK